MTLTGIEGPTDLPDIFGSQLALPLLGPSGLSFLPDHVGHVLTLSPRPDVCWVTAPGVVAGVAPLLPWWKRAVGRLPSEDVGGDAAGPVPELAMPIVAQMTEPGPTLSGPLDIDHLPEAERGWSAESRHADHPTG